MKNKRLLLLLTALCLILFLPLSVLAQEPEATEPGLPEEVPPRVLHIKNVQQFLRFAEQCRLDSFSQNLTVYLDSDLSLTDQDFSGVPIFSGTLEGQGHRISGLTVTGDGSNQGLFRFLTEDAKVRNLNVTGTVTPTGTQANVGGIAGVNRGSLEGCRFEGTLSGGDRVGMLAGSNQVTGIIQNCQSKGQVSANHFVGGIAGENYGVIRGCINRSQVNTTARESSVNVSGLSMETITGTESANTVTDIGGITGTNIGVIRDCRNQETVGYRHIGYNVGGIAGSQTGLIADCQNYGKIYGRKETGGIAGQFEPITQIEYTIDTLQILEKQLASAAGSLNQASYNAQSNLGQVGQGIQDLQDYASTAQESLHGMVDGEITDLDSYLAAKNTLGQSIQNMHSTMSGMGEAAQATVGQLNEDLKIVSGQLAAMSQTIRTANENMGVTLSDQSDQDTEDNLTGKIVSCENLGAVDGDLNTGGIAGSIAFENDLDPEDDLKEQGDRSLNFEGSIRAVILSCVNRGTVTVKKINAGGIIGRMTAGLVKNSLNTGLVDGEKAQFVGGIAGSSRGYLRSCYVKCGLKGSSAVGGIAGSGTIVSDCRSMVTIRMATEKSGAVLGVAEPSQDDQVTEPLTGNIYMSLSRDLGAVDGISYRGKAEPMAPEKFRTLPELPEEFEKTTLTFESEDERRTRVVLPTGGLLKPSAIPQVPQKKGYHGQWKDIELYENARVYFDSTLQPVYTPHRITIRSPQQRVNGRPVLLAEGVFPDTQEIALVEMENPRLEDRTLVEAWGLPAFPEATRLHLSLPEGTQAEKLVLLVEKPDGSWQEVPHTVNMRHLVFDIQPGDTAFCVAQLPDYGFVKNILLGTGAALLVIIWIVVTQLRKKKKKRPMP